MSEAEWAWVAGLFEGEGTVGAYSVDTSNRLYIKIRISMSDESPPAQAQQFTGLGILCSYISSRQDAKRMYEWRVSGIEQVTEVYSRLSPYLSHRRIEQFQKAITLYNECREVASPSAAYDYKL